MSEEIKIRNNDYWVKVVGMLQQNWAKIECLKSGKAKIFFIN